jgi:hypothetical protein
MRGNQASFIASHRKLLDNLSHKYAPYFDDYRGAVEEAILHASDPHQKRLLRVDALVDLTESGKLFDLLWFTRGKWAECKFKNDEIAKPRKKPRCVVDMHVPASLEGFRFAKFFKTAQATEIIYYRGFTIEFIPRPAAQALASVFDKLIRPPGRGYFCYFSDDSCVAYWHEGGVYRANVDISGCDRSHTDSLFAGLLMITPESTRADMLQLIEQCHVNIRIYSNRVRNDRKTYVELEPQKYTLYSGTTITTIANNFANLLIALAIAEHKITDDIHTCIAEAAMLAGYIVTVESADEPEKLQFLKYSPCLDIDRNYWPVLNLGVLLRSSGQCKRDLPGRGCITQRSLVFQSAFLKGLYPYTSSPFIESLKAASVYETTVRNERTRSIADVQVSKILAFKTAHATNDQIHFFTDAEIFKRYALDGFEVSELQEFGRKAGPRMRFAGTSIHKILQIDYGLGCPYYGVEE